MTRFFKLAAIRLITLGNAKALTNGAPEGEELEDKVSFFPI